MGFFLSALAFVGIILFANASGYEPCRCFPGDDCWPSDEAWEKFNATVGGRLIKTVPIGSVCHDPTYEDPMCRTVQENWATSEIHIESSHSIMQNHFVEDSCYPFASRAATCLLGNYVVYAVEAEGVMDVQETVKFARENNIRFVVRNTGHDFFGRSTGAGALAVWTHKLKDIEVKAWAAEDYSGPAMKLGAGIRGFEAIQLATEHKLVLLAGECPSVGVAGGYVQGGGHSPVSTAFGLAADQTLEFEVVTAEGELVVANREQNSDLFWALSGGSPGSFGVVSSVTVRVYPYKKMVHGTLFLRNLDADSPDFGEAVDYFHDLLPSVVDAGATVMYSLGKEFFNLASLALYDGTRQTAEKILAPFIGRLDELGLEFSHEIQEYDGLQDYYEASFGPLPWGRFEAVSYQFGSRLIPRSILAGTTEDRRKLYDAFKMIGDGGATLLGVALNVTAQGDRYNSVNPAWRDALIHMQVAVDWLYEGGDNGAAHRQITEEFVPALEKATPGSGAYVNEGDYEQPNWKETYYGRNYDMLLNIKDEWDPDGFFYGLMSVGSDRWVIGKEGRLCHSEQGA